MSTDRALSVSIYCEGVYKEFAFSLYELQGLVSRSTMFCIVRKSLFAVRGAGSERFGKLDMRAYLLVAWHTGFLAIIALVGG